MLLKVKLALFAIVCLPWLGNAQSGSLFQISMDWKMGDSYQIRQEDSVMVKDAGVLQEGYMNITKARLSVLDANETHYHLLYRVDTSYLKSGSTYPKTSETTAIYPWGIFNPIWALVFEVQMHMSSCDLHLLVDIKTRQITEVLNREEVITSFKKLLMNSRLKELGEPTTSAEEAQYDYWVKDYERVLEEVTPKVLDHYLYDFAQIFVPYQHPIDTLNWVYEESCDFTVAPYGFDEREDLCGTLTLRSYQEPTYYLVDCSYEYAKEPLFTFFSQNRDLSGVASVDNFMPSYRSFHRIDDTTFWPKRISKLRITELGSILLLHTSNQVFE